MKIYKQKKGELTTQQIVMLIILITSFAVILFFFFRLNLGETSNKEICHNSVVLKGKSVAGFGSLDCRTNYVCISGGGECEGINPTETKEINLIDSEKAEDVKKNKEKIMKAIADEMADCWWMFGEGNVNYLGLEDKSVWPKNSCAVCSTIVFDNKILDKYNDIKYKEFYEYLNAAKKDSSQTYFNYLYNSNNINNFQNKISYLNVDLDKDFIINKNKFNVVTGVKTGALWGKATKDIFIYSYYISSDKFSQNQGLICNEFITKA